MAPATELAAEREAREKLELEPIDEIMKVSAKHMAELYPMADRFTPERYMACLLDKSPTAYAGTLFPEDDSTLKRFESNPNMKRIPKLYPTKDGFVDVLYSFVSGKDAAVHRGIDVVYYLDTSKPSKYITGAVRFGLKASSIILPSYKYVATAHGGCAEAVLDDVLGTVVRHCQSVWMATSDFSAKVSQPLPASAPPNLFHFTSLRSPFPSPPFPMNSRRSFTSACFVLNRWGILILQKLRKPVPLMETLTFEAWVESTASKGLYSVTKGKMVNSRGEVVATGEAKMVDTLVLASLMAA